MQKNQMLNFEKGGWTGGREKSHSRVQGWSTWRVLWTQPLETGNRA